MSPANELALDQGESFAKTSADTSDSKFLNRNHSFSVNRDKLESILASQKSM